MIYMDKYSEIMDKIKVTPEMHKRIIENIQKTNFEKQTHKLHFLYGYRKYISMAACLFLFVASTILIHNFINIEGENQIQITADIVECDSDRELSSSVGFKVKHVHNIPFDVKNVQYISYWREIAEVIYSDDNNSMLFRMSKESGDISGDYNDYEETKVYNLDFGSVTIKGKDGVFSSAVWQDDKFSYSLQLNIGISDKDLIAVIEEIR